MEKIHLIFHRDIIKYYVDSLNLDNKTLSYENIFNYGLQFSSNHIIALRFSNKTHTKIQSKLNHCMCSTFNKSRP